MTIGMTWTLPAGFYFGKLKPKKKNVILKIILIENVHLRLLDH